MSIREPKPRGPTGFSMISIGLRRVHGFAGAVNCSKPHENANRATERGVSHFVEGIIPIETTGRYQPNRAATGGSGQSGYPQIRMEHGAGERGDLLDDAGSRRTGLRDFSVRMRRVC